ncbi:MAG TPA: AgmX/PglI C-terminal domain-containing protein [Polyangiaceae bacterium]|jgi:hypothetical protein
MRTTLPSLVLLALFAVPLAPVGCGGGQGAGDGAKAPGAASGGAGSGPADTAAAAGATAAPSAGPSTTTTTTLGAGGDLQGAKLTETHVVASTSASSEPPSKGPHGHDPGRGPADIRAIVVAHRDEARACYDASLKDHPGIEGDLVIQWTIDPKGVVTQVSEDTSRSQITEPTAVACVAAIIKKIQFAASPGGFETKAFYPFNFHPRHGTPPAGQ